MSEACKDEWGRGFLLEDQERISKEKGVIASRYNTTIHNNEGVAPTESFAISNTGAGGRKFDSGKLQYGLVPPNALKEIVKVLTVGAEKYDKNNWKKVPDAQARYYDALQRHLWDWFSGEQLDPETGINHLAHAACNILFLLERDNATPEEWQEIVAKMQA